MLALGLQERHQALRRGGMGYAGSAVSVAALCSLLRQQHHPSSLPRGPWGAELPGRHQFQKNLIFQLHC